MSYTSVLNHISEVLGKCGDPIDLVQTGQPVPVEEGKMSIPVKPVFIAIENRCGQVAAPNPRNPNDPPGKYAVNRVRISTSLADDYSKGHPFTDAEMTNSILTSPFLFAWFP